MRTGNDAIDKRVIILNGMRKRKSCGSFAELFYKCHKINLKVD
jgi:hypothetical protein